MQSPSITEIGNRAALLGADLARVPAGVVVGQVHELVDEVRLVQIVGNGTQLFIGRQATSVDSQPKHVNTYCQYTVDLKKNVFQKLTTSSFCCRKH